MKKILFEQETSYMKKETQAVLGGIQEYLDDLTAERRFVKAQNESELNWYKYQLEFWDREDIPYPEPMIVVGPDPTLYGPDGLEAIF